MPTTIAIPSRRDPTPRVLEACALLGLNVARAPSVPHPPRIAARRHADALFVELDRDDPTTRAGPIARGRGRVVLITGPSGAGKSTLLGELSRRLARARTPGVRTDTLALADMPLVDLFAGPVDRAMYWLSRVGLAEAGLIPRTPTDLSDGQRWRLRLGLALAGAGLGEWVLADEFASVLDRPTALAVARSASTSARTTGRVLVAGTARDDLDDALAPDIHRRLELRPLATADNTP